MLDISDVERCSVPECWPYRMLSGAVCLNAGHISCWVVQCVWMLDMSDFEWCSVSECWSYQLLSGAVCLNAGHIRCWAMQCAWMLDISDVEWCSVNARHVRCQSHKYSLPLSTKLHAPRFCNLQIAWGLSGHCMRPSNYRILVIECGSVHLQLISI